MLICSQGVYNLGEVLNLLIVAVEMYSQCLYAYDRVLQRKTWLAVGKKVST